MNAVERLQRNYRPAFLRYLPRRDEAALHSAYQLGRTAVGDRVSLLDLAHVHHAVLLEVLRSTPSEEVARTAAAASEFFVEVLATYEMTQRRIQDAPDASATS